MNIAEIYYKFNRQLIIIISGLSGTKKKSLAEKLNDKFNSEIVNLDKYILKNYDKTVEINNGLTIVDWDDIESYDWNSFNEYVNKSNKNLIIIGPYFPTDKLKFTQDIHVHLKISKQKLLENRHEYIKKHPDKFKDYDKIDASSELFIINHYTYPHYIKYLGNSKIDKTLHITDMSDIKIYEELFDYIIYFINRFVSENTDKIILFLDKK